jgi:hypothetical protein
MENWTTAVAGLMGPVVVAGAVGLVRQVHGHTVAIKVLEEKYGQIAETASRQHRENREDLQEIKETLSTVQRLLMRQP